MLEKILVDTHTHTVLSGHAWSTLRENARSAAGRGVQGMCLTEHAHAMPGAGPFFLTATQKMLPSVIEGVHVFYGVEANIMDMQGGLDVDDKALFATEFCVASMHDLCVNPGSEAENTASYMATLAHPCVDILGHIDDRRTPSDFEVVVKEAVRLGKLLEINNNSLLMRKGSRERIRRLAEICGKHSARVAVSSDAHFDEMVGVVAPALELLAQVDFPEKLVVNRTLESFTAYLDERAARIDAEINGYPSAAMSSRRMKARP